MLERIELQFIDTIKTLISIGESISLFSISAVYLVAKKEYLPTITN